MKRIKKVLSWMLVLCMIFSLAPLSADAAEFTPGAEKPETVLEASEMEDESEILDTADDETSSETEQESADPQESVNAGADVDALEEDDITQTANAGDAESTENPSVADAEEQEGLGEDIETVNDIEPANEIEMETIAKTRSVALDSEKFYKIFHLDCGRKYFSADQIKGLIDVLAENDYTSIELAIGNDGLRFLLDDMSVTANGITYESDAVKAGIQAGNRTYYDAGTNELTQNEMDAIIAYADSKGIEIIPLVNTPGHMDAILDAMKALGIQNPAYNNSARTVDVTNAEAVNFTLALVNKYIAYFAGKGCSIFNMGCDEYANDISNSGFGGLQNEGKYEQLVSFVNSMAAQVQNAGMVPMAFNDGIYYNSDTNSGTFDSNIVIAYWTSGWGGYTPASASFLAERGHKIINTNDAWYYVVGRTTGTYNYSSAKSGAENTKVTVVPGSDNLTPAGAMQCVWCDEQGANYVASDVNTLISTLALSNNDYFNVNSNNAEVTDERTITVVAGKTATDTISGVNYGGTYTTEDTSIATVNVTGSDGTEATVIYTSAGNVRCSALLSEDSNSWVKADYYYNVGENYYPVYVKRSSSGWIYKEYTYTYGYSADGGENVSEIDTQSISNTNNSVQIPLYRQSGSEAVPASTTVTFTGVAVGTTYVTIGSVRYTVNVMAEDLSSVSPRRVELWITNVSVESTDPNISTLKESNINYVSVSATAAYGKDGILLSAVVPATGKYTYSDNLVYWKGTRLTSDNKQTTSAGNDKTAAGNDFTYIRYYNGNWQYSADRATWVTISSSDQVVAYYLQKTEVTKEIDTLVKDWGFPVNNQGDANINKVALSVAVVYPDGTISPNEDGIYTNCTTIFNYWDNRDIGIVAPVNNSDYDISKITVTTGQRNKTSGGVWGTSDKITWEKTRNAAGTLWYDETTYWDDTMGTTPMVNGAASGITWSNYNEAKLVLIYLKPVHKDSNLTVIWKDDTGNEVITSQEIVVSYESNQDPVTFLNGLQQDSEVKVGTFTLDNDAYITNSSGNEQTFNKDLTIMSNIAGKYTSGLYSYVSADISEDEKTLTLHYKLQEDTIYDPSYVVDFGLPVEFPLSDLISNTSNVKRVLVTGNAVYDSNRQTFRYTPSAVLNGIEPVTVRIEYNDGTYAPRNVGMVPASTVYYEEGFAAMNGFTGGSKGSGVQASEKIVYEDTSSKYTSSKINNYGYDSKYAAENAGPSNNSQATSTAKGSTASFTFTGTGVDLYVNSAEKSGNIVVQVRDSANALVKLATIQTTSKSEITGAFSNTNQNGLIAASVQGLAHGIYSVKITTTNTNPVYFDGFRVYGTLKDQNNEYYKVDLEDNPTFLELRDYVLTALNVDKDTDSAKAYAQVYQSTDGPLTAVILTNNSAYDGNALLENGPKNELFLLPGQSVEFKLTTNRVVQLGMKAVNGPVTVDGSYKGAIISSTDMFYTVVDKKEDSTEQKIIITNTNSSTGILSITKVKICDDPNAGFAELTEEDLNDALVSLGITESEDTDEPEEPVEPEVTYADAALTVQVNDAESVLTKNGVVGEAATFTASEIEEAASALVADGFEMTDASYSDVTVAYGENDVVSFTAAEKQQETEPSEPDEGGNVGNNNFFSGLSNLVNKIWSSIKGLFGR